MTIIKVIIYVLTDTQGNKSHYAINDYTQSICVGGIGQDGKYHQYDSYEGIHAYGWAEKLGMKLDCYERAVDVP
jgi:hypothetical protein